MSKELSFIEKCFAKLKADDNSNIKLAVDQTIKHYKKQITIRERQIADLEVKVKEDLIDFDEQLQEVIAEKNDTAISIDVTKITTNESRKKYVEEYTMMLQGALDKVKAKENQIKKYKENAEAKINSLKEEIEIFNVLLNEMK